MAKIMIIDDEPDLVILVGRILQRAGHEVMGATSGKEALEKHKDTKPDLILLDIMMPRLDGWETLELIRKHDGLKDVPVSMLTAKTLTTEIVAREDIGELVDYIQKPITKDGLINKVNLILSRLENISREKSKLSPEIDESAVKEYQSLVKAEWLHESVLTTLNENLEKIGEQYQREITREVISSEQHKINQLKKRREEIERQLIAG